MGNGKESKLMQHSGPDDVSTIDLKNASLRDGGNRPRRQQKVEGMILCS